MSNKFDEKTILTKIFDKTIDEITNLYELKKLVDRNILNQFIKVSIIKHNKEEDKEVVIAFTNENYKAPPENKGREKGWRLYKKEEMDGQNSKGYGYFDTSTLTDIAFQKDNLKARVNADHSIDFIYYLDKSFMRIIDMMELMEKKYDETIIDLGGYNPITINEASNLNRTLYKCQGYFQEYSEGIEAERLKYHYCDIDFLMEMLEDGRDFKDTSFIINIIGRYIK